MSVSLNTGNYVNPYMPKSKNIAFSGGSSLPERFVKQITENLEKSPKPTKMEVFTYALTDSIPTLKKIVSKTLWAGGIAGLLAGTFWYANETTKAKQADIVQCANSGGMPVEAERSSGQTCLNNLDTKIGSGVGYCYANSESEIACVPKVATENFANKCGELVGKIKKWNINGRDFNVCHRL